MSEEDAEADSEAYDWWRWWHLLPMLALGVQAVLHTPVPGELFENAGRAFGAGIVVPVAAGASRWVVAKLGGFFYIRSRVWLVASVLALPAVLLDSYGWVAVLL